MFKFFIFLFFSTSIIAFAQGPILIYEFNGNVDDSSGNGLHGIINATIATDRNDVPNSCYFFNGISDYIDFPNSPILKPELPVSISFWVNFSSLKPGVLTTDFAQDIHTGVWVALNSEGKIAFSFGDGGSANPTSRRTKIGDTKLKTNVWYHILGIVRGATDMDIFINGINDCGIYNGTGTSLAYSNSPGSIGRKDSNPSLPPHYFHGYIDDFYYWDRVVEIEEIFNTALISPSTTFISFDIPGQIGLTVIDSLSYTIEATVNCSSSFDLIASFSLSGNARAFISSTEQISGTTLNNFGQKIIYTVTNSIGCSTFSSDWDVIIKRQSVTSSDAYQLTSFVSIEIQDQIGMVRIDSISKILSFDVICEANLKELYLLYTIEDNTIVEQDGAAFESGNVFDFSQTIEIDLINPQACVNEIWYIVVSKQQFNEQDILVMQEFFIPNVITPNQDGKNETFRLGEFLVGSELSIFNRYGISVYQSENYHNEFSGANLSTGKYYYSIDASCYSELIKGTISILR